VYPPAARGVKTQVLRAVPATTQVVAVQLIPGRLAIDTLTVCPLGTPLRVAESVAARPTVRAVGTASDRTGAATVTRREVVVVLTTVPETVRTAVAAIVYPPAARGVNVHLVRAVLASTLSVTAQVSPGTLARVTRTVSPAGTPLSVAEIEADRPTVSPVGTASDSTGVVVAAGTAAAGAAPDAPKTASMAVTAAPMTPLRSEERAGRHREGVRRDAAGGGAEEVFTVVEWGVRFWEKVTAPGPMAQGVNCRQGRTEPT